MHVILINLKVCKINETCWLTIAVAKKLFQVIVDKKRSRFNVCLFVYLFRSSKYRYNEAYTICNNELEQQGWLTSTNNCPSHTHAYTHTHLHTPTSTSTYIHTYIHTQCKTIWSRLKTFYELRKVYYFNCPFKRPQCTKINSIWW